MAGLLGVELGNNVTLFKSRQVNKIKIVFLLNLKYEIILKHLFEVIDLVCNIIRHWFLNISQGYIFGVQTSIVKLLSKKRYRRMK
jgi:hypothetical protein